MNNPVLHYYKRALEFMEISKDEHFMDIGMCHALTIAFSEEPITYYTKYGSKFSIFYYKVKNELTEDGLFKDLLSYRDDFQYGYWFPTTKKGREKRLSILKEIIQKLENEQA